MPHERRDEVERWLRFAREDLDAAWVAVDTRRMALRHACFHAQQAAEKAIKAALIWEGVEPPRLHGLGSLVQMLPSDWSDLLELDVDLTQLTVWAAEAWYPSEIEPPELSDAEEAVIHASRLLPYIAERLGLGG